MKPILITNFTKYDLLAVEAFIQKYNFIGVYAVIEADAFTDDVVKMVTRYALNVIIPVQCTEKGMQSIQAIDKRNAGFAERITSVSASKLTFLRESTNENESSSIITLALNYPNNDVIVINSTTSTYSSYFDERETVQKYANAVGGEMRIDWLHDLARNFEVINYGVLKNIGIIDSMSM